MGEPPQQVTRRISAPHPHRGDAGRAPPAADRIGDRDPSVGSDNVGSGAGGATRVQACERKGKVVISGERVEVPSLPSRMRRVGHKVARWYAIACAREDAARLGLVVDDRLAVAAVLED